MAHAARLGQVALVGETPSQRAGGKTDFGALPQWIGLIGPLVLVPPRIRKIAKAKNATATFDEGSSHTIVRFNGRKVTLVGRHNEIPEWTARGALRDAERWEP